MLIRRLASAAVIVSVLIGLIVADYYLGLDQSLGRSGVILSFVAVVVAMLSAYELVALLKEEQTGLSGVAHVLIGGTAVAICCLPVLWRDYPNDCSIGVLGWAMMALTFAIGLTLLIEIRRYSNDGNSTLRVGLSTFVYAQLILLFGFLIAHRLLFSDNRVGLIALIALITSVKMSDAAAYFVGKSMGRNKFAPTLSPGKTIEGLVGSVFGALAGTLIVIYLVAPFIFGIDLNIPVWWVVIYCVALTLAGVVGDLSESMLKRDARIKDSSSWLPGLGGVLDITDSLVFAAPVSYFLWVLTKLE